MGKVKSAIITALLLASIIVLTLFATISCDLPGSNGVNRYNSFISSIPLGSEFTGESSMMFYPSGVLTESQYEREIYGADEDKIKEYADKYELIEESGLYVEKDRLYDTVNGTENDAREAFIASIKADAQIISERFAEKGYTSYSVSVVDDYIIKVGVPSGLTYAAYKGNDSAARSSALSVISHTMSSLSLDGELSLRSGETYEDNNALYKELDKNNPHKFNSFIAGASVLSRSGANAVQINLTDEGYDTINDILTASSDDDDSSSAYLFVGDTNIQLTFTMGEAIEKTIYFDATSRDYAEDYAILINSVAHGKMLANKYNDENSVSLVTATPVTGAHFAVYVAVFALIIVLAAAFLPVIKYKKLGLVNAIMVLTYAIALTTAIFLIGIELTVSGIFTAIIGFLLLSFANFFTFEAVRGETALGRTIGAAVKLGYKKSMLCVIDIHVIMIVASIIMSLVGVGELAACGLIFLIGSVASFILYWFTRFMWYVLSSPSKNKFAFCGFAREVEDDE